MNGISLSRRDRWLIGLSVILPPLATYLKFGRSRTLTANCLLTACLLVPGVFHAIRSIYSYPSVVFSTPEEPKGGVSARDDSVIWELPHDHFLSISRVVRVQETQALALKNKPSMVRSIAGFSQTPGSISLAASVSTGPSDPYVAHMHGHAPLLNPGYGWGIQAAGLNIAAASPWAGGTMTSFMANHPRLGVHLNQNCYPLEQSFTC